MQNKLLLQFLRERKTVKIRGKKAPIIFSGKTFKIGSISKYFHQTEGRKLIGFDFLFIKLKVKSSEKSLFGKILARSSSDFLSLLANKLIKYQNMNRFKLIQYSLYRKDISKKLIILTELLPADCNRNNLNAIETKLSEFYRKYRIMMGKIIDRGIKIPKNI
ncbi:MAG: hypothetical protein ACTSWY_13085 [Promethearchaeota archaeon]